MRNKSICCIIGFMLFLTACSKKKSYEYVLEGTISGLVQPALYVVTSLDHDAKIDTVFSKGGQFKFISSSDSLQPLVIYMDEGSAWITVWAVNGDRIQIEGNAEYPELIKISGNETNDLLTTFRQENKQLLTAQNDSTREDKELENNALDFIEQHPASLAGLVLMQDYLTDCDDTAVLDKALSLVESPAKENKLYARLYAVYSRIQQTAVGSVAPDFSIKGINGDTITLETFKDRYLLLAFEDSGCPTCRVDCTLLKTLQKTYHKDGLDILSIVFEENPDGWKQLAKDCKIDWLQAIDSYGFASPLLSLYNVSTLPDYFLIDKNNKIVASHTSLKEIEPYVSQGLRGDHSRSERHPDHN